MTSENVSEHEAAGSAAAVSAKAVDDQPVDELVSRAQAEGLQLTGERGLLQQLTKQLLESALEGEITDHFGYDKHDPAGKDGGNSRNGKRTDPTPVIPAGRRGSGGGLKPPPIPERFSRLLLRVYWTAVATSGGRCWPGRCVGRSVRCRGPRAAVRCCRESCG